MTGSPPASGALGVAGRQAGGAAPVQGDAPPGALRRMGSRFAPLLFLLGLLVVWEIAAVVLLAVKGPLAREQLSAPHEIVQRLVSDAPLLASATWVTARGALVGLALGTVLGLATALILAQSRWVEDAFYPFILGGQMIPTVALAPIILIALKDPVATRTLVAAYISFFPISLGTLRGLRSTPRESMELMRSYNCSRFQVYRKLRLPAALPLAFAGFKVAAPLSVVGEIVVELTGATSGLGYTILSAQYYGPGFASLFWAAMVLTLLLGGAFYLGAVWLERLASPWQHEFRRGWEA